MMAAAARAYGRDVLAAREPVGASEAEAVGCQLFLLIFGGRTVDDDLTELLAAAGSGAFAPRIPPDGDGAAWDPLDHELWKFVSGALSGQAELRPQVRDTLAAFYRREADRGDVLAMADLGDLLREDDVDGSRDAYERAVASGDEQSLISLAELLTEHGDTEGAQRHLRQAVAGADPDVAAEALVTLARVLGDTDQAGAEAALVRAIQTRHPAWAPLATSDLGDLRARRGDPAGARAAYQMLIDSEESAWAASASESLAIMLEAQGDVAGAKAAYLRAAMAGDCGPSALWGLLDLLRRVGDLDGIRALHRDLAEAGRTREAAEALAALAAIGELPAQ